MAPNPPLAQDGSDLPCYTRQEVSGHKKLGDCWIVIDGEVYNVTSWLKKHPGGARLLMHYAGEDATVSTSVALTSMKGVPGRTASNSLRLQARACLVQVGGAGSFAQLVQVGVGWLVTG